MERGLENNRTVIFRFEPARRTLGVGAPILISHIDVRRNFEVPPTTGYEIGILCSAVCGAVVPIPQKNVGVPAAWLL